MKVLFQSFVFYVASSLAGAQTGASVSGRIVSSTDGTPIRRATVVLKPDRVLGDAKAAERDSYFTEADSTGGFSFQGVSPGAYQCEAARTGFEDHAYGHRPKVAHLILTDGQEVENVVLRLTPLGVISGRLLDPDGQPVAGADVTATLNAHIAGAPAPARSTSDDRGEYRLYGLYPGQYYIRAAAVEDNLTETYASFGPAGVNRNRFPEGGPRNAVRGPRPIPLAVTYYPNALQLPEARAVEVPAGGEAPSIDIHFQRRALYSIRGKVPPEEIGPIVVQGRGTDGFFGIVRFFPDGSFETNGVPPGSYILTRTSRRSQDAPTYSRAYVDVTDHDLDGVQLVTGTGVALSGTMKVTGKTPLPLTGLSMRLEPVAGAGFMLVNWQVRADGKFTVPALVPDLYHVVVSRSGQAIPPRVYFTSMQWGDTEVADDLIDLRRGSGAPLRVTVSADMGKVDGKVVGGDGQPLPAAIVTLIPDESKWDWRIRYYETEADAFGRFAFDGVVPGEYRAFAWTDAQRNGPENPGFRKPFEKLAVTIEVQPEGRQALELKAIDPDARR